MWVRRNSNSMISMDNFYLLQVKSVLDTATITAERNSLMRFLSRRHGDGGRCADRRVVQAARLQVVHLCYRR